MNLRSILEWLGGQGVSSVLIEGGGEVLASAFEGGLADEVVVFLSPILIGGADARTPVEGRGIDRVRNALKLAEPSMERIEEGFILRARVKS
jgi:diaminohydroxyphosphoribosylaminopyrimidine deaminase/5-amino-6-(5-phosphoribosylamino)uracil reductase